MASQQTIDRWIEEAGIDAERVKTSKAGDPVVWSSCGRCGGAGYFNCFSHIHQGKCFACGGAKGRYVPLQRVAASARKAAKAAAKAAIERHEAPRRAARAARAFLKAHKGLAVALRTDSNIGRSFARQLARKGFLSGRQVEVAHEVAAKIAARAEIAEVEVPEGRQQVEGKVVSVKETVTQFGITDKMLVEVMHDGCRFKVFGTVPRAISSVERGDSVRFVATLQPKERGFGFFSRPSKAEVVEAAA
jgi:hypothetical protein